MVTRELNSSQKYIYISEMALQLKLKTPQYIKNRLQNYLCNLTTISQSCKTYLMLLNSFTDIASTFCLKVASDQSSPLFFVLKIQKLCFRSLSCLTEFLFTSCSSSIKYFKAFHNYIMEVWGV